MHLAIFSSNLLSGSDFIQNLLKGKYHPEMEQFRGKSGALMAQSTLDKFIREEALHDDNTLTLQFKRSIQTLSSGEQRKALLNYLLDKNPGFIVLDGAFDMLDSESRRSLMQRFEKLSDKIIFIQLLKRKDNLLSFIKNAVLIDDDKIVFSGTVKKFYKQHDKPDLFVKINCLPKPVTSAKVANNPLVKLTDVNIYYGENAIVQNINWTIKQGDFWQLKGPNGSGKTTLLSLVTGDNPKGYGQDIVLFGKKRGSGESIWDIKKHIGYITPDMTTLFRGWNTLEKMVISGLVDSIGLYKAPSGLQRKLAGEWLKVIGLQHKAHTRFSLLNEGEKCMVLIARAMIKHPPLLILDEPTLGLDDKNAALLSQLVNKIAQEGNTTIIFVSHRHEPGLAPKQVFELIPDAMGSTGRVLFTDE